MVIPSKRESAVLMLSCAIAASANVLVMVLIVAIHRLRTSTNVYVLSLCLCNTIIALVLIQMRKFIVKEDKKLMMAYNKVTAISIFIYISNLTAVSRHRLHSIIDNKY